MNDCLKAFKKWWDSPSGDSLYGEDLAREAFYTGWRLSKEIRNKHSEMLKTGDGSMIEAPLGNTLFESPCASCGALITHESTCEKSNPKGMSSLIFMNERVKSSQNLEMKND